MREQKVLPKKFEFYFSDLDNLILVECTEDGSVLIRSTKNNFSEQRKIFFIRELAAEGFIPEHYEWFSGSAFGTHGIKWVKDCSWVKIPAAVVRRSNCFMKPLLPGACIFWLAVMRVVIVSSQPAAGTPTAKTPSAPLALSTPSDSSDGPNAPASLVR